MKSKLARMTVGLLAFASTVLLASPGSTAASKLVRMVNGKTIRAESVEPDGGWLMLTLEGGGVIGVLAGTVERVEDDLLPDSEEPGSGLNVVTSGRYIPPTRSSRTSRRTTAAQVAEARRRARAEANKNKNATTTDVRSRGGLRLQGQQQNTATRSRSNDDRRNR